MACTIGELAALVGGTLQGDADTPITGAAALSTARPGDITFVDSPDKLGRLRNSQASAVVLPTGHTCALPSVAVAEVTSAFLAIVLHFRPPRAPSRRGISPHAFVGPKAMIAHDVEVHAGACVEDDVEIAAGCTIHSGVRILAGCRIGPQVSIFPNAVLYEGTVVGPRCLIHAGAVLGAYGFGYKLVDGRHQLSSQLGWVELGADVEVGACTTIDRGTYGPTLVGEGTKLDNLVMIGHNCRLGKHNLICSQVGIAGSTTTGDFVVMAGQVGVRDHVHIGDGAVLAAQAGVPSDVPPGQTMIGSPARPMREQKLIFAATHKLPEFRRQLKELERRVAALWARPGDGQAAA